MPHRLRTALATAAVAALTGGLVVVAGSGAPAAEPPGAMVDFNGDGARDVAVSAPGASVAGVRGAGQVVAHYGIQNDGTEAGISGSRAKRLSQHSAGVPGTAEDGDGWGGWTAAGDFDGDGFTDLAVAAPGEKVGGDVYGGTVQLLWGGPNGLAGGTTLPDPRPSEHDLFGRGLAAGDFNGDGATDLAVASSSSYIDVFEGGFGRTEGDHGGEYKFDAQLQDGKIWGPDDLAAGDVNGDGTDDLVVDGSRRESNAASYVSGSERGLTIPEKQLPGGDSTVIGDVDGDGYDDVVTGQADESGPATDPLPGGKVSITRGSAHGPLGTTVLSQASPGVPGTAEQGDSFGGELALGDVDGDGHLDLAVAAANETLGGVESAGTVAVLRGAADGSGFGTAGATLVHQNAPGVPGTNETRDRFGTALLLADLNGDGFGDLTAGTAGENAGNGAVYALRSDAGGVAADGAVAVYPSSVGMPTTGRPGYGAEFAG
ncbi:FG-GAP and VCBS repeat-containing protein [Streptomyces sp. B8F3]|uniref:FG-GAP and VCBS repeat-containing protein n=1 Tax=Streptomyces sp. B8F3 TaxID=3153573 RepID=UPI00325D0764